MGRCRSCRCGLPRRSVAVGAFWPTSDGSAAVFCVCVTDEWGLAVSERERIVSFDIFLFLNSAETFGICKKINYSSKNSENLCVASVHILLWFKIMKLEI